MKLLSRFNISYIQKDLKTIHVLQLLDFNLSFKIEYGASSTSVGAILLQTKHLIFYFSKSFTFSDHLKSLYVRELLVVVLAF